MPESTPVSAALQARQIPHRLFRHEGPLRSLEQAARERGQDPDQVVRSIVFRLSEGQYAMVLIAGPGQISWPALRRHLGQSRLTMASEQEVLAVTGYARGTVGPFGLPAPMRILVDNNVLRQTEVSMGSGVRGTAIVIATSDLRAALGEVESGDFAATEGGSL